MIGGGRGIFVDSRQQRQPRPMNFAPRYFHVDTEPIDPGLATAVKCHASPRLNFAALIQHEGTMTRKHNDSTIQSVSDLRGVYQPNDHPLRTPVTTDRCRDPRNAPKLVSYPRSSPRPAAGVWDQQTTENKELVSQGRCLPDMANLNLGTRGELRVLVSSCGFQAIKPHQRQHAAHDQNLIPSQHHPAAIASHATATTQRGNNASRDEPRIAPGNSNPANQDARCIAHSLLPSGSRR